VWTENIFKTSVLSNEILIFPKIDFGYEREILIKVKYQFIGFYEDEIKAEKSTDSPQPTDDK